MLAGFVAVAVLLAATVAFFMVTRLADRPESAVPLDVMRMFVQWPLATFQQMGSVAGVDPDYREQLGT